MSLLYGGQFIWILTNIKEHGDFLKVTGNIFYSEKWSI